MPFCIILFFALAIVVLIISVNWQISRGNSVLEQWAQTNRYQLISSERRSVLRGPFWLTTSKGQVVYYLTVQLPDGTTKNAWARCGGTFSGMMSDAIDVRWEDETKIE